MYPAFHEKQKQELDFKRLDMLWEKYPQHHEMRPFSSMDALLEEQGSWQEECQ
ncbi:MAG: hypothetical protein IJL73_01525 [Lachnospiraceae bacterium]|nr:hypothetical protein [Lachnospiraceae bacterium]